MTLILTDRATGEVERIADTDPNFVESIRWAAESNGMKLATAMEILSDGQELATPGFVRRLEKAVK